MLSKATLKKVELGAHIVHIKYIMNNISVKSSHFNFDAIIKAK